MNQSSLKELDSPSAAVCDPTPDKAPSQPKCVQFTPIELTFLKLFGRDDVFGGISPALAEISDALDAAHRVYGLERIGMWLRSAEAFIEHVETLEEGRPELGLPSTEEVRPTSGDLLSRLKDHSLEADELLRVRALFGLRIAGALSQCELLPRSAIEAYKSLLGCRSNRSRQHDDWRTVCSSPDIDETGLHALKRTLKSAVVRNFIDDALVALARAITDPSITTAGKERIAGETNSAGDLKDDQEDPSEQEYGLPADIALALESNDSQAAIAPQQGAQATHDQPPAPRKISLIGWRIVDAQYAPFTRKLGLTTTWGATPRLDHTAVCRALKHDFIVGDLVIKNQVCLAYHSQQCSLPPQLALTVPLNDAGGLYYDVREGCYWAPYAQVLGEESPQGTECADGTTPRYGRLRIAIDPDLAQHHREQYERHPSAASIGDLIDAGASEAVRAVFLKRYRAYLRKTGDSVHPQYAGRHARSLGPVVKEITGSDVLAMFLALDGSMAAPGMLHYITLNARFVHAQQQRVLAELGWKPPPDLPAGDDEVLGAGIAIPWRDFIAGWKGVQAEAAEALSALGNAASLAEISTAWRTLVGARLLSFGCISGHRLTRIARLTGQALFGHAQYICISDKVTSSYDAYRLLPVTARMAQLRDCLLSDLAALQDAIERVAPESLKDAVAIGAPSKVVFFGLKVVRRNGMDRLKRTGLELAKVDSLSRRHFNKEANIGRHMLVSAMVETGVDHWTIRALTGHHHQNAEVFGDAASISPQRVLEQLRLALDCLLADEALAPHTRTTSAGQWMAFTRTVAAPPIQSDAYIHPKRGVGGRLLPPMADRHTLLALKTTDEVRSALLTPEKTRDPWIDVLLSLVAFDGMHHLDTCEIWKHLPRSLALIGATCAAAWTRDDRSNLLVVPLSPPTLAALARTAGQAAPSWATVASAAGRWLKGTVTQVTWPEASLDSFLAFTAMAARWLRLHLNPATYAASLRCVMSAALSAQSILRLATATNPNIPVDALSAQRVIRPGSARLSNGALRPAIRAIGRVLFKYGGTKKRHGEDAARATKVGADLGEPPSHAERHEPDDERVNEKAAESVLSELQGHQAQEDLPAMAALSVVRKEADLIRSRHKERRSWGSVATYWTEVALALELIPPTDDMRQWTESEFEAWCELTLKAIAIDARKKGKKGDLELAGLRRFLKIGAMLGWEVPPGLLESQDIYRQDGRRQSASAVLLMPRDFEAARPLVQHALRHWPLAQKRADLLLDMLIEVPARAGELDTLLVCCVTAASRMLCIQPAGFSALKNQLAVRLSQLPDKLADRLQGIDGKEVDVNRKFLFLDEDGTDWSMLKAIRDVIHQALLLVTKDVNLRFHSARGSAACRIAFPEWEEWARALIAGTTGASYGSAAPMTSHFSVASAIAALGHGRTATFIGYYYAAWPLVRAHELRLTLVNFEVPIDYEKQQFHTTQARRAAKCRAERSGQPFDHWDWIGRQVAARLEANPLESDQAAPVIAPEGECIPTTPTLAALTRYGLWTLAGIPSSIAGHHCRINGLLCVAMDEAISNIAPSMEAVWQRRGQARGERGTGTDLSLARGEMGQAFCEHFCQLSVELLSLLGDCLAVDRQRLLLFPHAAAAQNALIRQLASCMPPGRAKLLVREPMQGGFSTDHLLVFELADKLVIGARERDVGRHCLYQIAPADQPDNRKRIGSLTALTRAACIAAMAAHQVLQGAN